MTENETKLLRKYCINFLGRPWSEVKDEFEAKRLSDAIRWAESKQVKRGVADLLFAVDSLPDVMPEKPILNETTSEPIV